MDEEQQPHNAKALFKVLELGVMAVLPSPPDEEGQDLKNIAQLAMALVIYKWPNPKDIPDVDAVDRMIGMANTILDEHVKTGKITFQRALASIQSGKFSYQVIDKRTGETVEGNPNLLQELQLREAQTLTTEGLQ